MAILGAGLAGMSTAIELLDQGHSVELYESRSFIGGKVASYEDRKGNHVEIGLHVFFGCYFNLFRLMAKVRGTKGKGKGGARLASHPSPLPLYGCSAHPPPPHG